MNEREPNSRSLFVRRTGWLCAGLAAATGLYCICGPQTTLSAAGGVVRTERGTLVDESTDSDRVGVDQDVNVDQGTGFADSNRVERALFEADPEVAKPAPIRRLAGWPLKKKAVTPTTKNKPSLPKLWRSNQPQDPFAEADEEAQAEILAAQPPVETGIAGESGFTKSKSNRRRLLDFQGGPSESQSATDPEVAGKAQVKGVPQSEPDFETKPRTAVVKTLPVEEGSEDKLREMFEADSPDSETSPESETPVESTARTATKPPAAAKDVSVAKPPKNHFLSSGTDEIQQVSEADSSESPAAVPASQVTPLPSEALKLRAQNARQRLRAEVTRLEQAERQRAETPAPVPPQTAGSADSEIPTSTELPEQPEPDPLAEPQTAVALPAPQPKLDAELPARVRVDQVPVEPKSTPIAKRVAAAQPEPAMIRHSEPAPAPRTVGTQRAVPQPAEVVEPVIRPAGKAELPPVQVLANRGIELPAPEGWSAAVKLNARRAARLAALTGREPGETAWPQIHQSKSAASRAVAGRDADSSAYRNISRQGYRSAAVQQPVQLDKIEDDSAVRVLTANDSDLAELRDAHHVEESESVNQEPARIGESAPEPVVIAEYAAPGWSVWSLRLITAVSVLFGLYGMWCCRIRATDS